MKYKRLSFLTAGLLCASMLAAQTVNMVRGDSLRALGNHEAAIGWYLQTEPVNLSQQRRLYEALAECYRQTGNYTEAIRYSELLMRMQRGDNRIRALLNLTGLWLLSGQYEEVINALHDQHYAGSNERTRLVNLSSAYLRMNRPQAALDLLQQAICGQPDTGAIYRTALQNKGYVLWTMQQYEAARQSLAAAVRLFSDDDADKYVCLANLAVVEAECGNYHEGIRQIDRTLYWQQVRLGRRHPDYIVSLRKKAEILLMQSDLTAATRAFREYFRQERSYILDNFPCMTEDERQNFWAVHAPLLAECYATGSTDPNFLLDVAVFSKSVLQQTASDFQKLLSDDQSLSSAYGLLKSLRHAVNQTRNDTQRESLAARADSVERYLMQRSGAMSAFRQNLSIRGTDVRKALKNNRDRIVEFIQYTRNDTVCYAALLAGRQQPVRFIPLFTQSSLENRPLKQGTVKEAIYSRRMADKNRLYSDTLLGQAVWQDIMAHIPPNAHVYFVPDGLLHLLAVEYLCFDRPDCQLIRLSSSRQLYYSTQQAGKQYGKPTVLLVGGLDYDDASACSSHREDACDRRGSQTLLRDGMPPATGGGYAYLTGSQVEVDSISALLQDNQCRYTCLWRERGTEETVKQLLGNYDIAHLSTHGFCTDYEVAPRPVFAKDSIAEDLSMLRCGLILSGANRCARPGNEETEDGILTARELCGLDLSHIRLAVLSACQTGLGRVTIDGLAGLPRGLKKAGAGTLLVSLWEVDDRATQVLMSRFYHHLIARHLPPRQALQQAQAELRSHRQSNQRLAFSPATLSSRVTEMVEQPDYDSPCYWAAFVLIDATEDHF